MRTFTSLVLACAALGALIGTAPTTMAAPTTEASAPAFDAAARAQAIEAAAQLLIDDYVFPEVGAKAAAMLRQNLAAGTYDTATTPVAFARQVTHDLQAFTGDKHLNVWVAGALPEEVPPVKPSLFGFVRADRLKGNIGYIDFNSFLQKIVFQQGADVAMTALASTDALIIDLRNNDGGDYNAVSYMVSFFVDGAKPVHVNDIVWRKSGTTEYDRQTFMTEPTPVSYLGKPVYLLTSPRTFSGGEELAYDLQAMTLGKVVGTASKGGANPAPPRPIGPGLDLSVPSGRSEHPITKSNWEGKGVQPDILTAEDQSFAAAYALALKTVGHKGPAAATADAVTEARLLPPPRTTPTPGAEDALRMLITGMAAGQPPKEKLGYTMAWIADHYVATYQADMNRLGALQGITFVKVSDFGEDIYKATFANGALLFTIVMQPDGKIAMCWYQPA